jgi:transcription-repair coupling factor (superfamily II helicase)
MSDHPNILRDLPERLAKTTEGFASLSAALVAKQSVAIDGAWGSSAALSIAALVSEAPSSVLIVMAHSGDLEPFALDLQSFSGIKPARFTGWEGWPPEKGLLDSVPGERLRLLQQLRHEPPRIILTTFTALMQPVPSQQELQNRSRTLTAGKMCDPEELLTWLVEQGFKRVDAVEMPGEFSKRGGIVDLYSCDASHPIRMEFFGDEIESIREFEPESQRSLERIQSVVILGPKDLVPKIQLGQGASIPMRGHLCDSLPEQTWIVLVEFQELQRQGKFFLQGVTEVVGLFSVEGTNQQLLRFPTVSVGEFPSAGNDLTVHLRAESIERFSGNVHKVAGELDQVAQLDQVIIACQNDAELHRIREVLTAGKLAQTDKLQLVTGAVRKGFRLVDAGVLVLGSHELFHREQTVVGDKPTGPAPRRKIESRAIDSFLELRDGDYVVHVIHGIAIYRGMRLLDRVKTSDADVDPFLEPSEANEPKAAPKEEHLLLEFRDQSYLYVPVSKIDLIQKYVGGSQVHPTLSKLGGTSWAKKKASVEEALQDMASEMIELQALRQSQVGHAFNVDSEWQKEFEAAFPYQETPDQLTAIAEIKGDLEGGRPMDRLLCGDVGYGKTEVAIRAAFKVIDNGRQVAILVPTTVLAEQHYRTFTDRFAAYPFTVGSLNRFRSAAETREIIKGVAEGSIDVVIGTHRLLSKDVKFKDLGLVIIDEEQRFGVSAKEKLKQLRSMVDVMTMTATPIPRTLHLSLLGIRDISNLETPPPERLPVETRIIRWDDKLIRHAIMRELTRDGQIYFVHNRVHDIQEVAVKLNRIVPEARIVIGHGQMKEDELEKAMVKFIRREADILLATTIIESGVDIPNANTMFIDEAEIYGLADLHQLRGRVGRQKNRAYAYLLLNPTKQVAGEAALRLKAIEEFTELGSGFKIAMRDLEIRGAGNILGNEQSGHIASVGYEMYCQLLENAVRAKKNLPLKTPLDSNVELPWPAFLPRDYVREQKLRIEIYRRLARIRELQKLDDFRQELRDRYGPVPDPMEWLFRQTEIRLLAASWQIASVHRNGMNLAFSYRQRDRIDQLVKTAPDRLKVIDQNTCYLRLQLGEEIPSATYPLLRDVLSGRTLQV